LKALIWLSLGDVFNLVLELLYLVVEVSLVQLKLLNHSFMLDLSFFNLQFEVFPEELALFKLVFKVSY
jgi:hypothetical protein